MEPGVFILSTIPPTGSSSGAILPQASLAGAPVHENLAARVSEARTPRWRGNSRGWWIKRWFIHTQQWPQNTALVCDCRHQTQFFYRSVLSLTLTEKKQTDSSRGKVLSPWLIRVRRCTKTSRSSCSFPSCVPIYQRVHERGCNLIRQHNSLSTIKYSLGVLLVTTCLERSQRHFPCGEILSKRQKNDFSEAGIETH